MQDARCCVKNDASLFVGCFEKILRYSPYASVGKIIEIPVPASEAGAIVE